MVSPVRAHLSSEVLVYGILQILSERMRSLFAKAPHNFKGSGTLCEDARCSYFITVGRNEINILLH